MGLFNNIFGNSEDKKSANDLPWIELTTNLQLESVKETSKDKTQIIFKHSTRCGVSRMVMNQFKSAYSLEQDEVDLYYLDLLAHRQISNEIVTMFGIGHESPQLLIIKNGGVVAHESHGDILDMNLGELI